MNKLTLNIKVSVIVSVLLFLIFGLRFFEYVNPETTFARVSSVLFFVVLLFFLFVFRSKSWLFLVIFLFPHIWLAISVAYLEYGYSPPEIVSETSPSGATVRYVFYMSLFYLGCFSTFIFLKKIQPRVSCNIASLRSLYNASLFLTVLVLLMNGLIYGFPMLNLEQRFFYWAGSPFGNILSKLLAFIAYSGLIAGYIYGVNKLSLKSNKVLIFLVFICSALSILYANKFSWFYIYFFCLISGHVITLYGANVTINKKMIVSYVGVILVMGFFLLSSVFLSYKFVHKYETGDLVEKVSTRIFQMQGQLWWSVDELTLDGGSGGSELLLRPSDGVNPHGIFQIMELVMSNSSFNSYFANKIPLTGGFPATIIYNLGDLLGSIAVLFCGVLLGFIIVLFRMHLSKGNSVALVFLLLLYMILHWAYTLGSINIIFSWTFMLALSIVVLITIFSFRPKILFPQIK